MTTLLNAAVAAFTLTAFALTWLGTRGWWRSRRPKTGVLAVGFAFFALAGAVATWWLFAREDLTQLLTLHVALTSAGLVTIYLASVKR